MGICCSCFRMGKRIVSEQAKIVTGAVVDMGNALTTAVGDTVTEVVATSTRPPIEGARRAALLSLRPIVVKAIVMIPLACGAVYAVKVGIVHMSGRSSKTAWIAMVVQKVVPTVVMGVGFGLLFVINSVAGKQHHQ